MQPRQFLFLAFISFFSTFSWASKARLNSLSNPIHLRDPQLIFQYPSYLMELENFVSIESGTTQPTNQNDNAEGLVSYSINDESKMLLSVGSQIEAIAAPRILMNQTLPANYELSQNPLGLFFGRKTMGRSLVAGFLYSGKNDKKNELKESSLAMTVGYRAGFLIFSGQVSFLNSVDAVGSKKLSAENFYKGSVGFEIDTLSLSLDYAGFLVKEKLASVEIAAHEAQLVTASFTDTMKREDNMFFYRISFLNQSVKNKMTGLTAKLNLLPVSLGFEVPVNRWLIFRSSVKQVVFIHQTSDPVGYNQVLLNSTATETDYGAGPNSTTAAVGAGLKFDKILLDGSFQSLTGNAATQNLDAANFLSQVSLTYAY